MTHCLCIISCPLCTITMYETITNKNMKTVFFFSMQVLDSLFMIIYTGVTVSYS